jgi:hypothetical protein
LNFLNKSNFSAVSSQENCLKPLKIPQFGPQTSSLQSSRIEDSLVYQDQRKAKILIIDSSLQTRLALKHLFGDESLAQGTDRILNPLPGVVKFC